MQTNDALAHERRAILTPPLNKPGVIRLAVALHGFKGGHLHHALDHVVRHILNSNEVRDLAHNRG